MGTLLYLVTQLVMVEESVYSSNVCSGNAMFRGNLPKIVGGGGMSL